VSPVFLVGGTNPDSARPWIEFSQDLFPTLTAEQYRLNYDGVLLNSSPSLPFVDITSIEGLDSTGVRLVTHDREGVHGGYSSSEFETLRTITIEGNIYASPTAMETYLDSLKANFEPTRRDRKFFIGTDAGQRFVYGKSQGLRYPKDTQRGFGIVPFQVQIVCADPRIYTEEVLVSGNSTSAATFIALADPGGDRETYPVIRIFGAASLNAPNFALVNKYGSFQIQYTGTALTASDFLTIDMEKRMITLNYGTNVRSSVALATGSTWIPLAPSGNKYYFQHASGSAYVGSIAYKPAWR
jgi:hypothetical protein